MEIPAVKARHADRRYSDQAWRRALKRRVLHLLSQRPGRTGSGVTLDALVRSASAAGWEQDVIVGTPASDAMPEVGGLPEDRIHPLEFGSGLLGFDLPGMSDVMPYPSTPFSTLSGEQIERYRRAWRYHLDTVIAETKPDLIHSHHIWIASSLLKEIAPEIPVVTHCHGTGLRQMELCPEIAPSVRDGCARNDLFLVLHEAHAEALVAQLSIPRERVRIVGAGFRSDLFHTNGRRVEDAASVLYAGKLSRAKGLPWLVDAVERLAKERPTLRLHVAGSGAGDEATALRERMEKLAPTVTLHGQLSQAALGDLLRQCALFVLPSFYEGLPLVLVEAVACGCRVVCTELPAVVRELAPILGPGLEIVPMPRLATIDEPQTEELPRFVDDLANAIDSALGAPALDAPGEMIEPFTWEAVFSRVEETWGEVIGVGG